MLKYNARSARLILWAGAAILGLPYSQLFAQSVNEAAVGTPHGPVAQDVLDLSRAWRLAVQHDHTFQAAISEQAAAQTEVAQGRAGLLPQLQASYVRSKVQGEASQPNILGQRIGYELNYDSSNAYLQLQQPLLNYGRYADFQRGRARARQGDAVFAAKQRDSGIRLASAYLNVLLAHDALALQRSLASSLETRAKTLDAHHRHNEGTRTDAQETHSRLAIARADAVDASNQLIVASRELGALIATAPQQLAALRAEFPLPPLIPASLHDWLSHAVAENADVRAARQAISVADAEVDRAASRYLPTAALVATYGRANSENLAALSQRSNTFIIGIQINIPIFTGGYNTANLARTRSDRGRLQHELSATLEKVAAEVTRQYTSIEGGAERIRALQAAVASSQSSLDSANKGFSVGAWSNLDVLNAQDRLYQAKYELVKARLEYLLARLQLHAAAGVLETSYFDTINDIYLGTRISVANSVR